MASHAYQYSLPFMASLNLLDLGRLTNDLIRHNPLWPPMPTKIPLDIPKFEGKAGEDPQNHIMSYTYGVHLTT